jgi:tRNA A37 threonylcarbamoyladenosine modification protein TsaB
MQGLTPFVRELECARFYVPDALQLISDTLQEAGATEGEITEIRIGRGPGNYTGIRQSIAVAIGLAAPGGLPVRAVNSGALLDVPPDPPSRGVWVMGDARRGWWWGGRLPNPVWKLARPEEWMRETEGACLLSSDPARLDGLQVTEAYPRISKLLSLEPEQCAEPVEPLYLHPAV